MTDYKIVAGLLTVFIFIALRWIAIRFKYQELVSRRLAIRSPSFWILVVLCFLFGAGIYSQLRGIVFYTAHVTN